MFNQVDERDLFLHTFQFEILPVCFLLFDRLLPAVQFVLIVTIKAILVLLRNVLTLQECCIWKSLIHLGINSEYSWGSSVLNSSIIAFCRQNSPVTKLNAIAPQMDV